MTADVIEIANLRLRLATALRTNRMLLKRLSSRVKSFNEVDGIRLREIAELETVIRKAAIRGMRHPV